ncbi:MAG: GNAT family N-acetyltransferase [Chitinophagales bacterium]|nr:GNAT family N-acetyltransferase [Chitinophagales bacterium]
MHKLLVDYFKEIDTTKLDKNDILQYPYLDSYWESRTRHPFFIYLDTHLIGFVLVNDYVLDKDFNAQYAVAEFYIIPSYRKQGYGKKAAVLLFKQFKGKWEIRQATENAIAIAFWDDIYF